MTLQNKSQSSQPQFSRGMIFLGVFLILACSSYLIYLKAIDMLWEPIKVQVSFEFSGIQKKFKKDLNLLAKKPIFKRASTKKNADPFLEKYIIWDEEEPDNELKQKNRRILKALKKRSQKTGPLKPELMKLRPFNQAELRWVYRLNTFDHWDVLSNFRVKEIIQNQINTTAMNRISKFVGISYPKYSDLLYYSKLILLKGIAEKKVDEALRASKHLAYLCFSTKTLVGLATSIAILKSTKKILANNGYIKKITVSDEQLERLKIVAFTWPRILGAVWTGEIDLKLIDIKKYRYTGLCAASQEMIFPTLFMEEYLKDGPGLEAKFRKQTFIQGSYNRYLLRSCKLDQLLKLFRYDLKGRKYRIAPGWKISSKDFYARVPFVRQFIGLSFMSVQASDIDNLFK